MYLHVLKASASNGSKKKIGTFLAESCGRASNPPPTAPTTQKYQLFFLTPPLKVANFREFLKKNTIFNEHPVQGVQETNVFFPLYGGEQLILTRDLSVTHIEKRN